MSEIEKKPCELYDFKRHEQEYTRGMVAKELGISEVRVSELCRICELPKVSNRYKIYASDIEKLNSVRGKVGRPMRLSASEIDIEDLAKDIE